MPINYPTFEFLNEQGQAELSRQKPSIDPTVFGSFSRSFITAGSAYAYSLTLTLRDIEKQAFPQTQTGEFLDLTGSYEPLPRNPATPSEGPVSLPGDLATIIPSGTQFTSSNGDIFSSLQSSSVSSVSLVLESLTSVGTIATGKTSSDNTLATGLVVTIAGATPAGYNGDFSITVTGPDTFTYNLIAPLGAATGTITATSLYAVITIESEIEGSTTNLSSGGTLSLVNDIVGITGPAIVQFDGITGGADEELDDAYRARLILSRSILEGVFTQDQVKLAALSITGNTRVFVIRAALSVAETPIPGFIPSAGQVAVYVLRDLDDSITPSQTILDKTKTAVIELGAMPANTSESDIFVLAPIIVSTDYTFTSLVPDTDTMRAAVISNLQAFYQDEVEFEVTITEERYKGVIDQTVDLTTGQRVTEFDLSAPIGDIVIAAGEIGDLGTVTFS